MVVTCRYSFMVPYAVSVLQYLMVLGKVWILDLILQRLLNREYFLHE
jgi:hypothetical protein